MFKISRIGIGDNQNVFLFVKTLQRPYPINDIAILRLTNKLELGEKVATICLPKRTAATAETAATVSTAATAVQDSNSSLTEDDRYGSVDIAGTQNKMAKLFFVVEK